MKALLKVDDIIFNSCVDAEDILSKLREIGEEYGVVHVSDLYDLVGLECSYLMSKYVWMPNQLKGRLVYRAREGWVIGLPPASQDGSTTAKVTYREYSSKKPDPKTTPEPLTITINTDDIDDFDSVLAETFKYVHTITDRPIYISII